MSSQSEKQRQFIFTKRGEFKTKDKTPEKWKWISDKDWGNKEKWHYKKTN